jgi:adenylylsulfate kinase-like enzyme
MYNIITIHGPVGVGKSTLTNILREKLPTYSYVDRPFIKRGLKPAGRTEALKLSKEATYFLIKELVLLNQNIIVQEVNPESMQRKIGKEFFEEHNYRIIPFFISCSIETAIQRDINRSAKTVGKEGVQKIHTEYVKPMPYELVIDTGEKSIDECISIMISEINKQN